MQMKSFYNSVPAPSKKQRLIGPPASSASEAHVPNEAMEDDQGEDEDQGDAEDKEKDKEDEHAAALMQAQQELPEEKADAVKKKRRTPDFTTGSSSEPPFPKANTPGWRRGSPRMVGGSSLVGPYARPVSCFVIMNTIDRHCH